MKATTPFVQNADHAIAQCRAPTCQGRGECRTGEGGLGAHALVPAEGVELFCFQALIDFSEPLRLMRSLPIELGIVVIYILTTGNQMTPR